MSKIWSLLPLVAIAAATPAYAQTAGSISGRVEVRGGYDEVRTKLELFDEANSDRFSASDVTIGAEAGVDFKLTETILLGGYVGIDSSEADDCRENILFEGDIGCTNAGTNFTAGGRVGLPVSNSGLIYVKGGYSRGKFKGSYTDDFGDLIYSDSDKATGWHVGAGIELDFSRNVYAKAEYVHTRYEEIFKNSVAEPDNVDPTRHQLLVGVGFRFGAGM